MKHGPSADRKAYHHDTANAKFGIVVAEWNPEITFTLRDGAVDFLKQQGVAEENIMVKYASGAFELPLAGQYMAKHVDAVICIGCLIKGETPHFEYISSAVSHQLSELSIKHNKPFAFGVLTVNTEAQALDRAGGAFGNKGVEAAEAVYHLLSLANELK
ncbi:MAG: 6,7-dimethyl-8-ribityllumazine synthase [Bacteroidetes bacterium]|nr:6,7-dimethyl-8-ribityllumazine synthase [Bacteroidota bacterium]